jgi:allantoinase
VDWVVSDHACCAREMTVASDRPDDIWLARSGFGGTEYLLSGVFSEGQQRGMAYSHMAEVLAWNRAQRFGLSHKGDIAVGHDADLALRAAPSSTTARAWWARPAVGTSTGRRSADVVRM